MGQSGLERRGLTEGNKSEASAGKIGLTEGGQTRRTDLEVRHVALQESGVVVWREKFRGRGALWAGARRNYPARDMAWRVRVGDDSVMHLCNKQWCLK